MKNQKLTTTIIAGEFKGKKLELPSLNTTRSSKARLKESFFNVLQFDIIDTIFIEAFAGSGSIGLEAISRGAKRSIFIEKDKSSYQVLLKNCEAINRSKTQTHLSDTFLELPNILNMQKNSKEEIILYVDPPFDFRDGMSDIYKKCFNLIEKIENSNIMLVCFEHLSQIEIPEVLGKFELYKSKKFGKSTLSYYRVS